MPGKYAENTTGTLVRMPKELLEKLKGKISRMNEEKPANGAPDYNVNSVIRGMIERFVAEE